MASIKRMKAEYDFTAEEDGELTVKKGDVVFVNDDPSTMRDGWTFVEAEKGGTGFVPTDYLVDAGGVPPPAVPSSLSALATPASEGRSAAAATSAAATPSAGGDMPLALVGAEPDGGAGTFGAAGALSTAQINDALSSSDFSSLFASHEEWFKKATARRAQTFAGLQEAISDLCGSMQSCETRNNGIVQQISELDAIIDEERLKWQGRLEKERRLLEKEKSVLASVERGGGGGGGRASRGDSGATEA